LEDKPPPLISAKSLKTEKMNYRFWNISLGWLAFLVATVVYFITIEDTVSLWDCGEYITAAYKLEVGHPPGAPLFMVIGRLFSFFADPVDVAVWINRLSAISSSLTILFMFWSLTLLLKKLAMRDKSELSCGDTIAIFGSAFIGAMAYTFSDSFWFSAVEGEVYAMSSLFTAAIFWAILKWDEEMAALQQGSLDPGFAPNRWLLLIMFLLGLAIGVHLLGILVVPAMAYVIYFRTNKEINIKGFLLTGVLGVFILGFIQEGVIPGSISLASTFEVAFRNSLGLPFFSGTIFFFGLLIFACVFGIRYARKTKNAILYNATMGLIFLLIGYGSFAIIVIRSNANPPLDENDPENLVTLHAYLKREQYGSAPLLYGPYWNSNEADPSTFGNRSPFYLRRFIVSKGDKVLKAFKSEEAAKAYAKENTASVDERYFESNANDRMNQVPKYAQNTIFPRMYWGNEAQRVSGYAKWSGYDPNDGTVTEKGKDGKRLPTFGENISYFVNYQVNWMYWRYFMWNFVGRQNDIQGHGDAMRGNWLSGVEAIDTARLGAQGEDAPFYTSENPANNKFFFLPFIMAILGLFFHFYRAPKDAFILFLAFLFTGVAIVVYLNQKPIEPRERDYAFAASFYFFAFWIGIGVYALYEAFTRFVKKDLMTILMGSGGILLLALISDISSDVSLPNTMSWLFMAVLGVGAVALMMGLRKVLKGDVNGAVVAILLGLATPLIMGMQGWDDHDRSLKTSAHDLAHNYLESCGPNGIIFTNGDNDTFPLWYMQEVEGQRTDVRVANLSLMQTDWYTDQMKMRAYESDPLPIKFREDQILMYAGNTDQVLFAGLFELFYLGASDEVIRKVITMRVNANKNEASRAVESFNNAVGPIISGMSSSQSSVLGRLEEIKSEMIAPASGNLIDAIYKKYRNGFEILGSLRSGLVTMPEGNAQQFQELMVGLEESWNYTILSDAMDFVRNDNNLVNYDARRKVRVFPSSGFILPVNKENAVKSGVITAKEKDLCFDEIRFDFGARGITREQVMMLDVIANNDWKRGIYFSSPGGSDVSIALYQRGYVKQNGMAFELSPLKDRARFAADKMYNNLMNVYKYGAMNNPKVLTDYYTRRHTSQYRLHFASLADHFLSLAGQEEATKEAKLRNIQILRQNGRTAEADELQRSMDGADKRIKEYNEKAVKLIKRSLEVMPAKLVIDYGEPSPSRDKYRATGVEMTVYQDGILHDYVAILYRAGDKKAAEELGKEVARQLETILNYFAKSKANFAGSLDNSEDLYSALDSYFKLHVSALDPVNGDPKGELAKRTRNKLDELYKVSFPELFRQLEEKAASNGESIRRGSKAGKYARMLFQLQDYIQAIGTHYGYLEGPGGGGALPSPEDAAGIDMEELMMQMQMQDSTQQ
jgi:hypothetical protein